MKNYQTMQKITLYEAKKIKLFNRVEKKFVCTSNQLYNLLEYLKANYFVVSDNDVEKFPYHSLYFDTPDLIMFNAHENSEPHRQKIRVREYSDGEKFLEIKDKCPDKITRKTRIPVESYEIDGEKQWIDKNLIYDTSKLTKTLDISYKRTTFISKDKCERITIDSDISFINYKNNEKKSIDDIVIEIKQSQYHVSEFENILIENNIQQTKFSKYHIGIKLTSK